MDLKEIEAVFNTWTFNNCWDNYVSWLISRIKELELQVKCLEGQIFAVIYEIGGTVEGHPTSSINFLQRIIELKSTEARVKVLGNTQWVRIANDLTEAKSANAKLLAQVGELKETINLDRGFLISCPYCGEKMEERAISMQILHIICCADKLIGDNTNRVKELDGQLKTSRDAHADTMNGMGRKVLELNEAIGKVLKWRNLDGDGISDPLRKELYAHVKKEG